MDSGYAWVVLVACVALRALSACSDGIMGVLRLDFLNRFEASEAMINAIVAIQFGGMDFWGNISIWKLEVSQLH